MIGWCFTIVRLCVLPLEMIDQPAYCHRCSIHDLHPIDSTEWNMSLISRFKGIAMDTEFQMKVIIMSNLYVLSIYVKKLFAKPT